MLTFTFCMRFTGFTSHVSASSHQVLDCPRLTETLLSEFLPTSWTAPSLAPPRSAYGFPLASAMKLLRVVATSGRHACARLVCWRALTVMGSWSGWLISRSMSSFPSWTLLEWWNACLICWAPSPVSCPWKSRRPSGSPLRPTGCGL